MILQRAVAHYRLSTGVESKSLWRHGRPRPSEAGAERYRPRSVFVETLSRGQTATI
jgi:hypothetical protein